MSFIALSTYSVNIVIFCSLLVLIHQLINCNVHFCVLCNVQASKTKTNCQVSFRYICKAFIICHMLKCCMAQINIAKELEVVNLLRNPVWAEDACGIIAELITLCGWLVMQIPMLLAINTDTYDNWSCGRTSHFSPHHHLKRPLALYQTHVK